MNFSKKLTVVRFATRGGAMLDSLMNSATVLMTMVVMQQIRKHSIASEGQRRCAIVVRRLATTSPQSVASTATMASTVVQVANFADSTTEKQEFARVVMRTAQIRCMV